MSDRIKPIRATHALSVEDSMNIIKQALKKPTQAAIDKNRKMLDARKRLETVNKQNALSDIKDSLMELKQLRESNTHIQEAKEHPARELFTDNED